MRCVLAPDPELAVVLCAAISILREKKEDKGGEEEGKKKRNKKGKKARTSNGIQCSAVSQELCESKGGIPEGTPGEKDKRRQDRQDGRIRDRTRQVSHSRTHEDTITHQPHSHPRTDCTMYTVDDTTPERDKNQRERITPHK